MGLLFILFKVVIMSEDQSAVVTLKVRVTPEFREKIIATAKENNRSMNAEIVHRLEQSFPQPLHPMEIAEVLSQLNQIPRKATNDPRERRRLAKLAAERALEDMSAKDLVETLFKKLNEEGSQLKVEEVDRIRGD